MLNGNKAPKKPEPCTRLGEVVVGGKLDDHLELRRFAHSPSVTRQANELLIEHMCLIKDVEEVERYAMYLLDFSDLGLECVRNATYEDIYFNTLRQGFKPCTIPMVVSLFLNIDPSIAVALGDESLYFLCDALEMQKGKGRKASMTFRMMLKEGSKTFGAVETQEGKKKWKPSTRFIAAYREL
jgi:hypothetical protein